MTQTMNTGDVQRRLGVPITAATLLQLGFKPVGKDKRASLWDQADYPAMCKAYGAHIAGRANVPMQDKPEAKPKKSDAKVKPPAADDDDEL